ncbi:biliverdin-producing heme oxygenase [Microbacterium sp. H1-D42]|uniref:biliverdin-producing heme oxygenase n=1 Tax=Microbacterium sp. H1-D42 TaxID=2925844 RepID=UPI001F539FC5|nr:biliverdin-producing heme oxygenase [Microbacterium sp. H1-D42]UNK70043.1 biliverdin-producing heme oxygenase [Microbacterium sp. H1-D42]
MTLIIDESVIGAVTAHMNDDHTGDSLLIARAFGHPTATGSVMTSLDAHGGTWQVTDADGEHTLTLGWPGGEVTERPQIRREVVMIYRDACKTLGISPREEHAPAPADSHHGAAGHHGAPGHHGAAGHHGAPGHHGAHSAEPPAGEGFAHRIRTATWGDHGDSEGATFMADLMRGKGTLEDYTDLVVQHYFMYEALEVAARQLLDDPLLAPLHPEALLRLATLERDLVHLLGADWQDRIEAVPAAAAYAQRIAEVGEAGWIPGIIAHHYTRYLGDLSGGQMIARRMIKQFGFEADGVAFYDFAALGDLDAFKNAYRGVLDAYGETLSDAEQQRMLDEVRAAYRFNTAVFLDLGRLRPAA